MLQNVSVVTYVANLATCVGWNTNLISRASQKLFHVKNVSKMAGPGQEINVSVGMERDILGVRWREKGNIQDGTMYIDARQ